MDFYFKKVKDNVSYTRLCSYELGLAIILSLCFYFSADTAKVMSLSKIFLQVTTAIYTFLSGKDLLQEMKRDNKCNVFDLVRTVFVGLLCVVSFTCIDTLFK